MERKIKICYVINAFAVGGAETVVLNLCRKMPPEQFDVTVLSVLEPDPDLVTPMHQRFLNENIRTETMNLKNMRNPVSFFRFLMFLRQNQIDIVHGHNRPSDGWAVNVGKWAGVPHRLWTRHLVYQDMNPRQLKRYRGLSGQVPAVLAVSDSVRENCIEYEGIPAQKVITVENGIDTERFAPLSDEQVSITRKNIGVPNDAIMLLFVGRLADQKAPEGFVSLIAKLREHDKNIVGYMCGTGPLENSLKEMIEPDCGVHLLGLRDDIPTLLASADLFVSTSRNEGLPLNVMEAMAAGAPVVAPDIGQISCLFESRPVLADGLYNKPPESGTVPDELISEWSELIRQLLDDRTQLKSRGLAGREAIIENFSLEKMIKTHSSLYREFFDSKN